MHSNRICVTVPARVPELSVLECTSTELGKSLSSHHNKNPPRQISHPQSSAFSLRLQGYLAGLRDTSVSIYKISKKGNLLYFNFILLFVSMVMETGITFPEFS
ncbi:hypothetical protein L873DRAFT_1799399 [Choiromyces venosus 120613-1]|uniref:Uncharacterized protein n=1 Tax=Choiromyces venosus 120613-1 TaxID=1336337 RepID=A0A3N4KF25_9PEZI|nr:hypothetical protein L873DRAFT_1799399 [Choiromyces venosus 120613-1]